MSYIKRGPQALTAAARAQAEREFKATASTGTIRAVFATLNTVDADQDVTLVGAFQEGAPVVISAFGHASWTGALPVGKGTIATVGDSAILEGRFFLDTTHGRDTFLTVKELGPLGQWSYGYDATAVDYGEWQGEQVRFLKGLDVHEVSPVLRGAGVGTQTLDAKSYSELEAIRAGLFEDDATAQAAATEYARFVRTLAGAGR
jgi:hypothetical protein